jgi:uncharacterized protein YjbI with pentapeptide repeats
MNTDNSNKNLQKGSFVNEDLTGADFSGSDLRGADFTGADLTDANFSQARTGITPGNVALLFIIALAISLLSGFIAVLAGISIRKMLLSDVERVKLAGVVSMCLMFLFIIYAYFKGVGTAIAGLIVPVLIVAILVGAINLILGVDTAPMLYLILSLVLIVVMVIVGTAARAAAGALSGIIFVVVALSGGIFGKNLEGGIGTVIMAIACAMISKRALSGAKGFDGLKMIACYITSKFGTSFRQSKLTNAKFSKSRIRNADFTEADLSNVDWDGLKRVNCISHDKIIQDNKRHRHHG